MTTTANETTATTKRPYFSTRSIYPVAGMECECCGRKITKAALLNTGHEVGRDCAEFLRNASFRIDDAASGARFVANWYLKASDKRIAFLRSHGYPV